MSRVAKKPISLPKGVECQVKSDAITVKGPKGSLSMAALPGVDVAVENGTIQLGAKEAENIKLAGTARALLANMVTGVTDGYQRKLELVGVGYRAALQGKDLHMTLGFSHPILYTPPAGVNVKVDGNVKLVVDGIDRQAVGQVAAIIRGFKPPEPYKGKGVRYLNEVVVQKEVKKS